jgi:hypothetical protein
MVNMGKTKVMIVNGSKNVLLDYHFFFRGQEIDIIDTYTYFGLQFSGPRFSLRHDFQPWVNKGYKSLAILE